MGRSRKGGAMGQVEGSQTELLTPSFPMRCFLWTVPIHQKSTGQPMGPIHRVSGHVTGISTDSSAQPSRMLLGRHIHPAFSGSCILLALCQVLPHPGWLQASLVSQERGFPDLDTAESKVGISYWSSPPQFLISSHQVCKFRFSCLQFPSSL